MNRQDVISAAEAYLEKNWPAMVQDIDRLVKIESVEDLEASEPGAPFGPGPKTALTEALSIAEGMGFSTCDVDGYMGYADLAGAGDKQIGIIGHMDVVPAGPGWHHEPYAVTEKEGFLIGRGVLDDKGPSLMALHAMKCLADLGLGFNHTIRFLFGVNEESGMNDVPYYRERFVDPAFLFTPDAEFPVCNAEKGCFGGTFASAPIVGGVIHSWSGAEATNAIPSESVCVLGVSASELPAPRANADRVTVEALEDGSARIFAQGIGGHASLPEGTINAIALVVGYLREVAAARPELFAAQERAFLDLLACVHEDTAGRGLGIASESAAFGPLTCNAGTIEVVDGRILQTIDVRFPDSITADEMRMICNATAAQYGAEFCQGSVKEPFSVSADSPCVQALLNVYRQVTGRSAEPFSMGGGTYARNFASAVSFGPEDNSLELPAWAGTMHGPNEAVNEALLRDALKMYILALLRLNELDL